MKQEVKAKLSRGKKLFEWDRSRRLLSIRIKQKEYVCELAEDNTFVCVAEKEAQERDHNPRSDPENC